MNSSKEKGFTLIELLSVIVILSIILLIAIPVILNVIEDVRLQSFKLSTQNIIRTAEFSYAREMVETGKGSRLEVYYENKNETSNKNDFKLEYKGEKPDNGVLVVNNKMQVETALYNKKYGFCAQKNYNQERVQVSKNISLEDCLYEINSPKMEIMGENPLDLEIILGEVYTIGDGDFIAYDKEGEVTSNVEIYVDGIEINKVDRSILNKEYNVVYKVIDGELFKDYLRLIRIVDTTPPEIVIPNNITLKSNEVLTYNLRVGVSVTDNSGEEIEFVVESGLSKRPGRYEVKYVATDSSGNTSEKIRFIDVVDESAPVITLLGQNPININLGDAYVEPGATAVDDVDGDLTGSIEISGTVEINQMGSYQIIYSVKDLSGNTATATRNVNVIDNEKPILDQMNVQISSLNNLGFIISRNGDAKDNHSGLIDHPYFYEVKEQNGSWEERCQSSSQSCNITNIKNDIPYQYRICVKDKAGNIACKIGNTNVAKTQIPEGSIDRSKLQKSINVSNINALVRSRINTGNLSYIIGNNKIDFEANNGTPVRSVSNSQKYSHLATDYRTSTTNVFSNTIYYSQDGFVGNIPKYNASFIEKTDTDTKAVSTTVTQYDNTTFPSTQTYNVSGYVGTLSKDGSYTTGTRETIAGYTETLWTSKLFEQKNYSDSMDGLHGSGGFYGSSYPKYISRNIGPYHCEDNDCDDYYYLDNDSFRSAAIYDSSYDHDNLELEFIHNNRGSSKGKYQVRLILTHPTRYRTPYTQKYSGQVTKSTPIYRQNYQATLYKEGFDNYYAYNIVYEYNLK